MWTGPPSQQAVSGAAGNGTADAVSKSGLLEKSVVSVVAAQSKKGSETIEYQRLQGPNGVCGAVWQAGAFHHGGHPA